MCKTFPFVLLVAALVLSACGVGVQLDQTAAASGATASADAGFRATVEAEVRATMQAEFEAAASEPAPSSEDGLSEAELRSTIEAEFQATATAQAAQASPAPQTSGGATETLPTPSAEPTAEPTPAPQAVAEVQVPPAMLLLLDSSGSMLLDAGDGRDKITAAKEALKSLVDALPNGAPVGLRVYGHRFPNTDKANGCQDSELVQPVGPLDKTVMQGRIDSFGAQGYTPIALTLEQGYGDLPAEGARTMVLVSDGEETCDRDPCQVARELEARGVELVIEPIGFQVDDNTRAQLTCIAEATGGTYRDAANASELADQLKQISNRALREFQIVGGEIAGGGDFRSATPIQAGEYIERMQFGETVYYRIEQGGRRSLRITATIVPTGEVEANYSFSIQVFDDQRQGVSFDNATVSERAGGRPRSAATETNLLDEGYYVSLTVDAAFPELATAMQGREVPIELIVEINDR